MRICSFLPSATEVLFAYGLEDDIVGVTYACDEPEAAREKPVVVNSRVSSFQDSREIDRQVREFLGRGESLYTVNDALLAELEPDLIVTQDLCMVCAASPNDLPTALSALSTEPKVLTLAPRTLQEVWQSLLMLGEATRRLGPAADLVGDIRRRTGVVERAVAGAEERPRVACLEWLKPPFAAGHWVPEMVALAGGEEVLGRAGEPSFTVTWEQVLESRPDVIVVCPCGFDLERTLEEIRSTDFPAGWEDLPAVRNKRVYAVEANRYFSRPNHNLIVGVEILAGILQEEKTHLSFPPSAVRRLE